MIQGSVQEEDIAVVNIYTPNIGAAFYLKQILMDKKAEINNNTGIAGDLKTPLTLMDRSSKLNINKEMALNVT